MLRMNNHQENIAERIFGWVRIRPEQVAIDNYGEVWTYARLGIAIDQWAARFVASGIKPRDIVLVFLPQTADAIAVYFGLIRCGAVPSFMPLPSAKQEPDYYWKSHHQLLGVIRPAALVTLTKYRAGMLAAGFDALLPLILASDDQWTNEVFQKEWTSTTPEDTALLQHSSGTTSLKKGVMLSHRAIVLQVEAYASALAADAGDVVVSWLPMYHDMGLIACTVMPLMLGQKLVLLDPFRWVSEPRTLLTAINEHRGTLTWLPNFAFELLAKTVRFEPGSLDLSSMRAFINCSEPCKPKTFDRFLSKFAQAGVVASSLQVCYAMAETVFAVSQTSLGRPVRCISVDAELLASEQRVTTPRSADSRLDLLSAGPPIAGMDVTIVGADGNTQPPMHVGEIELNSEFLFGGYLNRPEVTAQKLRNGRYRTNDLGFMQDGQLYVLGRTDDLIIVHGRNYFAHEVEAVVNDLPGLKPGRNVAVGVFNEMLGSLEVVVIAELNTGVSMPTDHGVTLKRAVKHAVAERMGLELRDVKIVDPGWLAKTTSGKISRSLNLDKYLDELSTARHH